MKAEGEMGNSKNQFYALTPVNLECNEKVYTEALDYAFSNDDVKNIAITGIYGSGKSTVWKTYVKEKKLKNIITVTLGKFEDNNSVDPYVDSEDRQSGEKLNSEADNRSEDIQSSEKLNSEADNRVEKQLINQMLSQIDTSKIPLSKYKFKRNKTTIELLRDVFLTILFFGSILAWFAKDEIINNVLKYCSGNPFILLALICGFTFFLPLAYFIYFLYRNNTFKVSKISFKGAEANMGEVNKDDESILDRDIREIVYILKSSNSKIIVFEDLDRHDSVSIFSKLRELNFLLNASLRSDSHEDSIKFVYMLRDGMFFSKNRTKFFDFILPIVPIIDSSNSESKLKEFLIKPEPSDKQESSDELEPSLDEKIISKISQYIDDMRLLKNIVNEYIVYQNIVAIKDPKSDKNKLFSLIVLKNIFPKEFDLLQEDKGYIYNIFKKINNYRETRKSKLDEKLKSIKEAISTEEKKVFKSEFEAIATIMPANLRTNNVAKTWPQILKDWSEEIDKPVVYDKTNTPTGTITYNQYVERYITTKDEYEEVRKRLQDADQKKIDNLKNESQEIKSKIDRVNTLPIKEMLADMDFKEIEELFSLDLKTSNSNDNFSVYNNNIFKDHYFPLIKILILEGLLDETYWHYKGYFYTGKR